MQVRNLNRLTDFGGEDDDDFKGCVKCMGATVAFLEVLPHAGIRNISEVFGSMYRYVLKTFGTMVTLYTHVTL
jgi:hypothetical protein